MADRPGFWAVLPASVRYDAGLPPNAKLLYAEISALCDSEGYCFANNRYFAGLFAISVPTVQRLIKTLADKGYIQVEVERDKATNAVVERRIFAGWDTAEMVRRPHLKNEVTSPQKEGDPSPQNCENNKEEQSKYIINTPLPPKGGRRVKSVPRWKPERFSAFWDFYSHNVRGESRQAAVKAWDKLRPDDALIGVMGQALLRQLATDEWKRGVGLPYASTWLNNRRWEDVPSRRMGGERFDERADDGIVRESGYVPVW
ncbi:helix-turn-helix domain-containing protein [Vermiculatibacterium agrestimuris]|uniref:helix-turn-helix domain-containing protein n=1 Tax=Vermiculatibacterium agrestimuris TaxID=2941519 RepID=UPI00203D05D6|nr:helix-turn-helix domain-containing protein [Vermiculatibacterium agrestimuris]